MTCVRPWDNAQAAIRARNTAPGWGPYGLERANGIEPSTSSLGSLRSTTELRPRGLFMLAGSPGEFQR